MVVGIARGLATAGSDQVIDGVTGRDGAPQAPSRRHRAGGGR